MFLYHYYDKMTGPFMNLSELANEEANFILKKIKENKPKAQSAQRDYEYMFRRRMYEDILRKEFLKKGGIIKRDVPHYMVVEHSPWLSTWFENSSFVRISIEEFDTKTISFTYGDSHPTFSPWPRDDDWKEYRRKLYTYEEILEIIKKYGLPQDWNNDGNYGPERYIEAHIWSDDTINKYRIF
ncbi:hypothetical protein [Clostridium sp.]|uniref:hypothetical protein n=1 Tax=Clostridium sp. TaxID=1506 RepID=UPI002903D558|nr:hypothetical protein [Clostridium sp.]MDU1402995.1 hypothetical protein [Clostridium sp.]MDU4927011.1 hypothetical protein [Clostridium sp.]